MVGTLLLAACGLAAVAGSLVAEFTPSHVFNERWPAEARRTSACFGLLNAGLGLVSLGMLTLSAPLLSGAFLLLMDVVMLAAWLAPRVDIVADGERVVARLPVSYWSTLVHLALVLSGVALCLTTST